jgi:hypothetical protein
MTDVPPSFPERETVFDGSRAERFLAVALETAVHDVSPTGNRETAKQLGGYALGEESPPEGVPEYVDLDDGRLTMSNPPFLRAVVEITGTAEYELAIQFDSDLDLLIDPPVTVTLEGPIGELVETLEQMVAEIYRTKGRRLEMLDAGTVDPEAFAERR